MFLNQTSLHQWLNSLCTIHYTHCSLTIISRPAFVIVPTMNHYVCACRCRRNMCNYTKPKLLSSCIGKQRANWTSSWIEWKRIYFSNIVYYHDSRKQSFLPKLLNTSWQNSVWLTGLDSKGSVGDGYDQDLTPWSLHALVKLSKTEKETSSDAGHFPMCSLLKCGQHAQHHWFRIT